MFSPIFFSKKMPRKIIILAVKSEYSKIIGFVRKKITFFNLLNGKSQCIQIFQNKLNYLENSNKNTNKIII